ncbi:hypothetical protein MCAG_03515 [Micromonospora sp. ATCC 39149]|nr:hypothetical protein MCAG_03515 [Micromonospora sp. ATCC 39149]
MLIDAQAGIGLAQAWGGGLVAAVDGVRFVVPVGWSGVRLRGTTDAMTSSGGSPTVPGGLGAETRWRPLLCPTGWSDGSRVPGRP